ncbi:Fic family protein (plasmid) [Pseudomonas sp. FeN3W]|nr:Fic family protein [Pseudomonas sp. FeN3W]
MAIHTSTAHALINAYRKTFALLQGYDEGFQQPAEQHAQEGVWPLEDARQELAVLRTTLIGSGEATELFGNERGDAFEALWGNLQATVFGSEAYPSIECRAAHLLYFVVKNHPFSDGNKRSGAYLFISYLHRQCPVPGAVERRINPYALAALTVLVAESKPDQKELLIELIIHMLEGVGQ